MKKLKLDDILETKRCILRIPKESEAELMWNLISESTTQYMIWSKGETPKETRSNVVKTRESAQKGIHWDAAVYDKISGELLGRCGINNINEDNASMQLGYWISEKHYGKGIIPECVNRYLEFAFIESEFEKVIIKCESDNLNSAKVALKCGFTLEGDFKKHELIKGELRNTKYFGILREEYLDNR